MCLLHFECDSSEHSALLLDVSHFTNVYMKSRPLKCYVRVSNQADVELDMINAISAPDIAFIMSSSQAIVN